MPPPSVFFCRLMRFSIGSLALLCLATPLSVFAERINAYTVHIEINENGSMFVQEEILYDFGETPRHGILRHIPLIYRLSGDHEDTHIELSSIMITDGKGNLIPTQLSGGGNFSEFKIGDPETLITGTQFYVIRYTVYGALRSLSLYDELVWNVTGNKWTSTIDRLRAEVVFPRSLPVSGVTQRCFVELVGEGVRECASATSTVESVSQTMSMVRFEHTSIPSHGSMTVIIGFPKNTVTIGGIQTASDRIAIKKKWDAFPDTEKFFLILFVLFTLPGMFFLFRDRLHQHASLGE